MTTLTLTPRQALALRIDADDRRLSDLGDLGGLGDVPLPLVTRDIAAHYLDALDLADDDLTRRALDLLRRAVRGEGR